MVRRKIEKTTALLIAGYIIVSSLFFVPDWNMVGLSYGCGIMHRIGYSFFHVSFLHALLNAWCLLSLLFIYDLSFWQIVSAYFIAAAAPDFVISPTPTVGLSGLCFALLGMIAFRVERKIYYNACMALYVAVGFLFPLVNGWLHLYSYVAGLLVGFFNMPIQCKSK